MQPRNLETDRPGCFALANRYPGLDLTTAGDVRDPQTQQIIASQLAAWTTAPSVLSVSLGSTARGVIWRWFVESLQSPCCYGAAILICRRTAFSTSAVVAMSASRYNQLPSLTKSDVPGAIEMNESHRQIAAPCGLVVGAILGVAGTFAPSASVRGLLWGIDGVALVLAGALLTIYHLERRNNLVAAGFLVFVAGQTLVLATAATPLNSSGPMFGSGVSLWAASLILISVPAVMPVWVRVVATIAAVLFAVVAVQLFQGQPLDALSRPLPFFAYPLLAATMFGWAWAHYRPVV